MSESDSEWSGYASTALDDGTASYLTTESAVLEERRQRTAHKWHERIKEHYRHRKFIEPEDDDPQVAESQAEGGIVESLLALPGLLAEAVASQEDGRVAKVDAVGEPRLREDGEVDLVTSEEVKKEMDRSVKDDGGVPVFSRRYIVYETKFVGPDFGVESEAERLRKERERARKEKHRSLFETLGGFATSVSDVFPSMRPDSPDGGSDGGPPPAPRGSKDPEDDPANSTAPTVSSVASRLFGKGEEDDMPKEPPKYERFISRSQYYGRMRPDLSYREAVEERERDEQRQRYLHGELFRREAREKALKRSARAGHAETRLTVILDGQGEEILRPEDDAAGDGSSVGDQRPRSRSASRSRPPSRQATLNGDGSGGDRVPGNGTAANRSDVNDAADAGADNDDDDDDDDGNDDNVGEGATRTTTASPRRRWLSFGRASAKGGTNEGAQVAEGATEDEMGGAAVRGRGRGRLFGRAKSQSHLSVSPGPEEHTPSGADKAKKGRRGIGSLRDLAATLGLVKSPSTPRHEDKEAAGGVKASRESRGGSEGSEDRIKAVDLAGSPSSAAGADSGADAEEAMESSEDDTEAEDGSSSANEEESGDEATSGGESEEDSGEDTSAESSSEGEREDSEAGSEDSSAGEEDEEDDEDEEDEGDEGDEGDHEDEEDDEEEGVDGAYAAAAGKG